MAIDILELRKATSFQTNRLYAAVPIAMGERFENKNRWTGILSAGKMWHRNNWCAQGQLSVDIAIDNGGYTIETSKTVQTSQIQIRKFVVDVVHERRNCRTILSISADDVMKSFEVNKDSVTGLTNCATLPPDISIHARSRLHCASMCVQQSLCQRFNYGSDTGLCQLYLGIYLVGLGFSTVNRQCTHYQTTIGSTLLRDASGSVLVQQHFDGVKFFNRSWNQFKVGFGNPAENYWIGNEWLYETTNSGKTCTLKVLLLALFDNTWYYMNYFNWVVDSETNKYMAHFSTSSGSTGDGMQQVPGKYFSTWDRDNDIDGAHNCAAAFGCGIWFGGATLNSFGYSCGGAFINGYGADFVWKFVPQENLKQTQIWINCV